jgi:hypothetical protein
MPDDTTTADLIAERDRLLEQLALQRDGDSADLGIESVAPEPIVRDGEDATTFRKSDVVPSLKLVGAEHVPTHDDDGFPLTADERFALLWRRA